jgi:uncharacterized protein (DUF2147 family)
MAKSKKHAAAEHTTPTRPRWHWLAAVGALVVVSLAALALLPDRPGRQQRKPPSATEGFPAANTTKDSTTSSTTSAKPNTNDGHSTDEISLDSLKKIVGRWKRSDAEYVLKIKSVDPTGKLEATYLNPSDIHVAKATAHSHGDNAHMTIELRDVNYPGCIYDLTYNPKTDDLTGTYFQAALGETYDVKFERSE